MSTQQALILPSKQGNWVVGPKDIPKPGPDDLLVKIEATALNPIDWKIQAYGWFVQHYPAVLGFDAAGIVEQVGSNVTSFAKGDKVLYTGAVNETNSAATFQQFSVVAAEIAAKVPNNISLDQAASIGSGIVTAVMSLYNHRQVPSGQSLGLTPFWQEGGRGKFSQEPIVVFGGSSSVGQYVIQVARLSGFSPIIATASLHNTDLLTSLGATHVLDRKLSSSALSAEIAKITSKPIKYVYDAISLKDTQNAAYDVLAPGGQVVYVLPNDEIDPSKKTADKKVIRTVTATWSSEDREIGVTLFSILPELIEKGEIRPNRVEILPNGLKGIIDGLERLKQDKVSGTKLVAHPQESSN